MGTAHYFNGTNAYGIVQHSSSLYLSGDFTVLAWVMLPITPTGWRGVVDKGRNYKTDFYLLTQNGANGLLTGIFYTDGTASETYCPTVKLNQWNLYAFGVSGSNFFTYLNTSNVRNTAFSKTRAIGTRPLTLGARNSISDFGNIYISSVYIYNRALSSTEIQQIYNTPNNPPTNGLVLWFSNPDFTNECCKAIWTDKSGNGNNAKLYNVQMAYY